MTLTKQDKENMTIKVRKSDPNTTAINTHIPNSLNLEINRKLIDLKEIGVNLNKADYIARCIEAGHRSLTFE